MWKCSVFFSCSGGPGEFDEAVVSYWAQNGRVSAASAGLGILGF